MAKTMNSHGDQLGGKPQAQQKRTKMSIKKKTSSSVVDMGTSGSHPKYSEMILEAISASRGPGKLNVSRPTITKYVTAKYKLEVAAASRHINSNLKKMLESGAIKPGAIAGRKGAGSFRLPPTRERKDPATKKVKRVSPEGKVKKVSGTKPKKAKAAKMKAAAAPKKK